jgi:hypothetical protein
VYSFTFCLLSRIVHGVAALAMRHWQSKPNMSSYCCFRTIRCLLPQFCNKTLLQCLGLWKAAFTDDHKIHNTGGQHWHTAGYERAPKQSLFRPPGELNSYASLILVHLTELQERPDKYSFQLTLLLLVLDGNEGS